VLLLELVLLPMVLLKVVVVGVILCRWLLLLWFWVLFSSSNDGGGTTIRDNRFEFRAFFISWANKGCRWSEKGAVEDVADGECCGGVGMAMVDNEPLRDEGPKRL